jgi:hypothetical protein
MSENAKTWKELMKITKHPKEISNRKKLRNKI